MIWVRVWGIDSAPLERAGLGLSYKSWTGVAQSGAALGCERRFQERIGVKQAFRSVWRQYSPDLEDCVQEAFWTSVRNMGHEAWWDLRYSHHSRC